MVEYFGQNNIKNRKIMKTVQELNQDELEQLKWNYFYDEEINHNFDFPYEIPDEVIFEHFGSIGFVEEDFWCNSIQ